DEVRMPLQELFDWHAVAAFPVRALFGSKVVNPGQIAWFPAHLRFLRAGVAQALPCQCMLSARGRDENVAAGNRSTDETDEASPGSASLTIPRRYDSGRAGSPQKGLDELALAAELAAGLVHICEELQKKECAPAVRLI